MKKSRFCVLRSICFALFCAGCYQVVGVCREKSVGKLDSFKDRMTIVPVASVTRRLFAVRFAAAMAF